jgi:penicillin-binding protein 1A
MNQSSFQKKPIKDSKTSVNEAKRFFATLKKRSKIRISLLVLYIFGILTILGILSIAGVYFLYLKQLPAISDIETMTLPESSVIRDKNGAELYSVFSANDGKRTYIPLEQISENIRNAVVSTEDKTFFQNQGLDYKWLIRSVLNYVTGKTDRIQGTSTISQQLIKITFLSAERSLERKIKEGYLSYRLNSEYSKEKILELYLNKISFWHNASGIEEASKAFFGKSAQDVWPLWATILASLPKGPTYYSPYNQRARLMGYLYVYEEDKTDEKITLGTTEKLGEYRVLVEEFKNILRSLTYERINDEDVKICGLNQAFLKSEYSIDANSCSRLAYKDILWLLNNIRVQADWLASKTKPTGATGTGSSASKTGTGTKQSTGTGSKTPVSSSLAKTPAADFFTGYSLEYNTGRKDFVATRMLEDNKLSPEDFTKVVVDAIDFQFKKNTTSIKYPHFVMYVQEYITKKYGDDFFEQWGLQIYTSLDPKLQDKAEEILVKQVKINKDTYGASSAGLVSIDNKTGQILAMVGGPDYHDTAAQGQVNVTTSLRQPGSSFKPLVYALAMSKDAIGPETPIYDVDTSFGKWNPDNYDQKFMGKMKIRNALAYSRNIPAIKLFKVAWGESEVVKFAQSLWITGLRNDDKYGMPLALGTGEVRPIELAQAYSVFANEGWRKEINPIVKIIDKKWNVIEQFSDTSGKYIFSDAASYLLSSILSDSTARPSAFWNTALTLKDRPAAAKTGTSNKDVSKWGVKKILPRDLWTAGYTPQITTVVWAGNLDWSETKSTCDGLNCAAPMWRDYMEFAHKWLPIVQFKKPQSVVSATISSVTGKLATDKTPQANKISGFFAVKPIKYESAGKQMTVDVLCNGKVTPDTPEDSIKTGILIDLEPIVESYDSSWVASTRRWSNASSVSSEEGENGFITGYTDTACVRPSKEGAQITVSSNLQDSETQMLGRKRVTISYLGTNEIRKLRFINGGEVIKTLVLDTPAKSWTESFEWNFSSQFSWENTFEFVAVDMYGYTGRSFATVNFWDTVIPPVIKIQNPTEKKLSLYKWQQGNLRFEVSDVSEVAGVNLYQDGKLEKILWTESLQYVVPVGDGLEPGKYRYEIRAINSNRWRASEFIEITILPQP